MSEQKETLFEKKKTIYLGALAAGVLGVVGVGLYLFKKNSVSIDAAQLSVVPLFKACDESQLNEVVSFLTLENFTKGEIVVKEGASSDNMFFILQGTVEVVKKQGLENVVLDNAGVGTFFGEMGIIFNRKRSVSVVASENVVVAKLTKDNFQKLTKSIPAILTEVETIATERFAAFKTFLLSLSKEGEVSEEQLTEFKSVFDDIDDDGNGNLDKDEFFTFITRLLAREPTTYEVEMLWEKIDEDKNGTIEFDEFINGVKHFIWLLEKQ